MHRLHMYYRVYKTGLLCLLGNYGLFIASLKQFDSMKGAQWMISFRDGLCGRCLGHFCQFCGEVCLVAF